MINEKLTIIGCGNMGQAFAEGLLKKNVFLPANIIITDEYEPKLTSMREVWSVSVMKDNKEAVKSADILLLAVKPQQLREVLGNIIDCILPDALLFSIAAGFSIQSITDSIGRKNQPIVRVMPNLAAKVGLSVSGWIGNSGVTSDLKKMIQEMLQAVGMEFEVGSEDTLDTVTAVSGSGPAYYYYFTEAITESAKKLGLSDEQAAKLANYTLFGAAELLKQSGKTPAELRAAVTSKGGTTEAAIKVMEEKQLFDNISDALSAAKKRAEELKS